MTWTRTSLFYLATYLTLTGLGFLLLPRATLAALQAEHAYDDVFVRFVGAFMLAVATLVVQIVRHRLEVLYPTTLGVRLFFLAVITGLYLETHDRLFLVILAVVGLGFALTAAGLWAERAALRRP